MNKVDFYKQMIEMGQELLAQEQKPKVNEKARNALHALYEALDIAVNAAADLEIIFQQKDIPRFNKAAKAVKLIMKVQELMNPLAEDEDIQL